MTALALPHIDIPISVNAMAEALNGIFKAELIEAQRMALGSEPNAEALARI